MSDAAVRELASRAGISVEWIDAADRPQRVSVEVLRRVLAALGLPAHSPDDLAASRRELTARRDRLPPMITATSGDPIRVPMSDGRLPRRAQLTLEDGTASDLIPRRGAKRMAILPACDVPGYHTVEFGQQTIELAVAPRRCHAIEQVAPGALLWALAVQVYGLRRAGDAGIGDMGAVATLAQAASRLNADALALSPMHAMFAADTGHFGPYSPSTRLFRNPLHADPGLLFDTERIARALTHSAPERERFSIEQGSHVDWPRAGRIKLAVFRRLFEDFAAMDLAAVTATTLAADFKQFRAAGGELLEQHARFEALHKERVARIRQHGIGAAGLHNGAILTARRAGILPTGTTGRSCSTCSCNGLQTGHLPRPRSARARQECE